MGAMKPRRKEMGRRERRGGSLNYVGQMVTLPKLNMRPEEIQGEGKRLDRRRIGKRADEFYDSAMRGGRMKPQNYGQFAKLSSKEKMVVGRHAAGMRGSPSMGGAGATTMPTMKYPSIMALTLTRKQMQTNAPLVGGGHTAMQPPRGPKKLVYSTPNTPFKARAYLHVAQIRTY